MFKKLKNYKEGRVSSCIFGKDYTTLEAALNELQILSFDETVFLHKAKTMYKIANNAALIYLTDLIQFRSNESNVNYSQLNLRSTSNGNYLIPRPKINLFKIVCFIPVLYCGTVFLYGLQVQV